jgi:hypothetical protein
MQDKCGLRGGDYCFTPRGGQRGRTRRFLSEPTWRRNTAASRISLHNRAPFHALPPKLAQSLRGQTYPRLHCEQRVRRLLSSVAPPLDQAKAGSTCRSTLGSVAGERPHSTQQNRSRRITRNRRRRDGSLGPLGTTGSEERPTPLSAKSTISQNIFIAFSHEPYLRTYGLCVNLDAGGIISRLRGCRPSFIQH